MSSTTYEQLRHARNRRAFTETYRRCAQMLDGSDRATLQGYLRTWQKRLDAAPLGSELFAGALGATSYLKERLHLRPARPARRRRRRPVHRVGCYPVRGSKW